MADVRPSKLELLHGWLPRQPWYSGGDAEPSAAGAFRFDDPDGDVGVETLLLALGDGIFQVPLTYRAAPMDDAGESLIGTLEHSVLGTRWVYDAPGDPVYARALADTILLGGREAELLLLVDGTPSRREGSCTVRGTGAATVAPAVRLVGCTTEGSLTVIDAGNVELRLHRTVEPDHESQRADRLVGTLVKDADATPLLLATAHVSS